MREELHRIMRQAGNVDQDFCGWMTVNQRICHKESTLFASYNVHGTEMVVCRTDTDDLFRQLCHFRITAVNTCDKCIRIAGCHHHHTESVPADHLFACFRESNAFACSLFRKDTGVAVAAFFFAVVAQVDDFDTFQAQVFFGSNFFQTFFVA